jgi:hypothetical protein
MWDFPNLLFAQGNWMVASNNPNITPNLPIFPMNGYWWTAVTANPSIPETAPAGLPGIGGTLISSGDKILWDTRQGLYLKVTSTAVEARFGLNMIGLYGDMNVYLTDDDTYRRIISWHFFKQDGNYMSIEFLKRRVWRFIWGVDGKHWDFIDPTLGAPHPTQSWPGSEADPDDVFIADTRQISVTFGTDRNVTIRFVLYTRLPNAPAGGAMCNAFGCNGFEPAWAKTPPWDIGVDTTRAPTGMQPPGGIYMNDLETNMVHYSPLPFMSQFKQAMDLGVIEMPYQFNWTCHIG